MKNLRNYYELFLVYLLTIATNIKIFFTILSFLFGVSLIIWIVDNFVEKDRLPKKFKRTIGSFIVVLFLAICIPTTKEAIIIVAGGKTLDYVQKDENLQKIPYKATEVVAQYLDSKIKELEEDTKKK